MGSSSTSLFSICSQKAVNLYDKSVYKTYTNNGLRENVLVANGHTVHYFDNELENKPTLLLVHGFGGDGKVTWEKQIKTFREDFRIVVPDLLWFGESHSTHEATLQTQVDGLKTLIDALHLKEVHLVGVSFGGFVTLIFASTYKRSLRSLTIVSSPGNVMADEEVEDFCIQNNVSDVKEIFVPKNAETVKRLFHVSMVKPPPFPMVVYQAIFERYFCRYPHEQEKLLDDLPKNKDRVAEQLEMPVLLLWGARDIVFSIDNAYKLQKKLGCKLVVHPTTGHNYPQEESKHFNAELLNFIQSTAAN